MNMCDINKKTPGPSDSDRGRTNNDRSETRQMMTGGTGEDERRVCDMSAQAARNPCGADADSEVSSFRR